MLLWIDVRARRRYLRRLESGPLMTSVTAAKTKKEKIYVARLPILEGPEP